MTEHLCRPAVRMSLMAEIPETRFAKLGNDRIAYQVVGEGPPDLLWLTGLGEPIDSRWDFPPCTSFVRRLASTAPAFSCVLCISTDAFVDSPSLW